jgi:hypothetical protein
MSHCKIARPFGQVALVLIFSLLVGPRHVAQAELIGRATPPTLTLMTAQAGPDFEFTPDESQLVGEPGEGIELREELTFSNAIPGVAAVTIRELEFDPDPFVLNNILVTNNSAATQIFTASVTLPTTFAAPNIISGGLTVSVIDGGNNGATLATTAGSQIYEAQIDGAGVATLFNHPFSLVAPTGSFNLTSSSFGPGASLVPVTSTIGIVLRFSLTAGDSASILSRFDVVIPEPASMTLGGVAMLAALAVARRRR